MGVFDNITVTSLSQDSFGPAVQMWLSLGFAVCVRIFTEAFRQSTSYMMTASDGYTHF